MSKDKATEANSNAIESHISLESITEKYATVSDRIRYLHSQGYTRSQIADFLGKRYQHVRNVLVEDARKAKSAK